MDDDSFLGALRKNWYLMIPSVVLIGAGYFLGEWMSTPPAVSRDGITTQMALPPNTPAARAANENFVKPMYGTGRMKKVGKREERKYLAKLDALNPNDEEYALTLFRLGNVYYSVFGEYEKAIPYFQELIDNHPDHPMARLAVKSLADCFAKSNQLDREIALYEELMAKHPPDSVLYEWAEQRLALVPRRTLQ